MQLNNPALEGVDPWDPTLSDETKAAIMEECRNNLPYFAFVCRPKLTPEMLQGYGEFPLANRSESLWDHAPSAYSHHDWFRGHPLLGETPGGGARFDRAVFPPPVARFMQLPEDPSPEEIHQVVEESGRGYVFSSNGQPAFSGSDELSPERTQFWDDMVKRAKRLGDKARLPEMVVIEAGHGIPRPNSDKVPPDPNYIL